MQDEHNLDYRQLSSEYIKSHIGESRGVDELTCLLPKDDQSASSVLRESGFRYIGKRLVDGKVMTVFKWFRHLDRGYEDMRSFFNRRARDYDLHMRDGNDSYDTTFISLVKDIPDTNDRTTILDLGCGTGAELRYIFQKSPNASVVCIDVAEEMLAKLRQDYGHYGDNIETICSSYLGVDFGEECYDYVVTCNSLHHVLPEDKADLYINVKKALQDGGYLLISDYVADTLQEEESLRANYLELVNSGAIDRHEIYHIDLVLTLEHEVDLLEAAGFAVTRTERVGETGIVISARS